MSGQDCVGGAPGLATDSLKDATDGHAKDCQSAQPPGLASNGLLAPPLGAHRAAAAALRRPIGPAPRRSSAEPAFPRVATPRCDHAHHVAPPTAAPPSPRMCGPAGLLAAETWHRLAAARIRFRFLEEPPRPPPWASPERRRGAGSNLVTPPGSDVKMREEEDG